MKQVCIINTSLGMRKGKIARVAMSLGYQSVSLIGRFKKIIWATKYGCKGVILKSGEPNNEMCNIIKLLNDNKIKYVVHCDAGHTQVPRGSVCGVAFFVDKDKEKLFDDYKLL